LIFFKKREDDLPLRGPRAQRIRLRLGRELLLGPRHQRQRHHCRHRRLQRR